MEQTPYLGCAGCDAVGPCTLLSNVPTQGPLGTAVQNMRPPPIQLDSTLYGERAYFCSFAYRLGVCTFYAFLRANWALKGGLNWICF